jgi:putative transposase
MPRTARLVVAGLPFHVTQRGVNRAAIFVDDDDRRNFCRLLRQSAEKHAVAVHGWVLMDNHVHLLLTPARADSLALAMKRCGQLHTQAFNRRHGRCGSLVQGRFHSSPVENGRHFLEVLRYIELNPVRAGLVADPARHPWSSVHVHLANRGDPIVQVHPEFLRIGGSPAMRASTWSRWLRERLDDDRTRAIRECLRQGRPFGGESFRTSVAAATGRPAVLRGRGRPPKAVAPRGELLRPD